MTWYYLTKAGERGKVLEAPPPRLLPVAGGGEGEMALDPRPDEERVLDGYPGYVVAFTLDRPPGDFEHVDEAAQALAIDGAAADAFFHAKVDRDAGAFRLNFITDVPGQQGTYIEKEKQALRCLAEEDEAAWPMIAGEAAARGITPAEMAAMIVGIAAQWRAVDAVIETTRIGAKLAVSVAAQVEAKRAAAEVDWAALLAPGGE